MCQHLPTGEFQFLPTEEWDLNEILATPADADYGYFIECDLSYPENLHPQLNEYPPAPVKKRPENLSKYQEGLLRRSIINSYPDIDSNKIDDMLEKAKGNEKLIASLEPKKNYICHYRLLQKFVQLGMKVDGVHRIVKFRQKAWMKEYIEFNTVQRSLSRSDFEKDLYKLMNNR